MLYEDEFRALLRPSASDYDELLRAGSVITRPDDPDAWRAEIRAKARADKIKVSTGTVNDDPNVVWAALKRERSEAEVRLGRAHFRAASNAAATARRLGLSPRRSASGSLRAVELRDRVRAAQEQMASAQAALDEAERQDVASAAQRAREGQALGTPPVSVRKAREALDLRKRDHAALVLAQSGAEVDLAAALAVTADDWASALDTEIAQARERARAALDQFEQAMSEISTSATAALWLASGRSDARWDRRPALAFTGTVALSSRARTINGEPMPVSELVAYLHEALEPPTSTQTSIEPTTSRA